jgi:hypothetical protein
MSSGRYCVIRELGLVKGGKGVKHHEVLLALTPGALLTVLQSVRGSWRFSRRTVAPSILPSRKQIGPGLREGYISP